jgi:histidine ammonia-lyase
MSPKGEPAHSQPLPIGGRKLTLDDVVRVARSYHRVAGLSSSARAKVAESAAWVDSVIEAMERSDQAPAYYGINTGFGAQAGKAALHSAYETRAISRNLIASHSAGVGPYFDEETVRAALLLRAHSLAQGVSGVSFELIEKLIAVLNAGVYPAVPSRGSLGASGDLAPLAHLALAMSAPPEPEPDEEDWQCDPRSGEAFEPLGPGDLEQVGGRTSFPACHITTHRLTGETTIWKTVPGAQAMARAGGPLVLRAKEGLGLNNGTTFSTAIATLTLHDAHNLLKHAELALALSLEGLRGVRDPFLPRLHEARGHPGAMATARTVLDYVRGSQLLDPGDEHHAPVRVPPQDPYSLRCAPQVLGAVRETLEFVARTVTTEINAATDNPLIFMDYEGQGRVRTGRAGQEPDYLVFSGGNFHGEPIAFAMDFLGIAITELGNIAERRIFKMTDYLPQEAGPDGIGLPSFLIAEAPGHEVSSGYMIPQYTAAALVSECKTLAHPDSVDSIPSSANREDHVSMSLNAALHARAIVDNVEAVIAIELLCAAQAIDLQARKRAAAPGEAAAALLGAGTRGAYARIREQVPHLDRDRVLYPEIRQIVQMIRRGEILDRAR